MSVNTGLLHHTILTHILKHGFAPEVGELAAALDASEGQVASHLQQLQDEHGVVLHPDGHIWVIHPFSLAPTNFLVRDEDQEWWGNCAWCSLGIAALLGRDVTITTTLGANDRQVRVHIREGEVVESSLWVHFPVPMQRAWDNVIYTCSTMLLFDSEAAIDEWCRRHRIEKGDVQPIATIWEFARAWYGDHLRRDWRKWTTAEAQAIFERFGLTGRIWEIEASEERF